MTKYELDYARTVIFADDISVYPQTAMKGLITYAGDRAGEKKKAPIKVRLVYTENRALQFAFEFQGSYHVERIAYAESPPEAWQSYGKFWLSQEQAWKLIEFLIGVKSRLNRILKEVTKGKEVTLNGFCYS